MEDWGDSVCMSLDMPIKPQNDKTIIIKINIKRQDNLMIVRTDNKNVSAHQITNLDDKNVQNMHLIIPKKT